MSDIVEPGSPLLFMKVGVHANESLEDIIERKNREYESTGNIFWGYGGGTCHPLTQVQPFAKEKAKAGQVVRICMNPIDSHHVNTVLATEYSEDGIIWKLIPEGINVIGSRFAIVIGELQPGDLDLDLSATSVAVGASRGKSGHDYISGRVDKACLEVTRQPLSDTPDIKRISVTADILSPFAVLLK